MYLGGSGCAADTVTTGTSAQKHNHISRIRIQTFYIFSRSCAHNSANLHTLCRIIRMINLFYIAGCQTNLVSIGAVAAGSTIYQLSLRQLAMQGFRKRTGRICCAGYTHCLIYIGTAGKRIADCSAQTGRSAAEGLDLRRMVVSFILKVYQPLLSNTVDFHRNHNTAGINLVRNLQILQFSLCPKLLHSQKSQIHQADKFIVAAFVKNLPISQILIVGFLNWRFIKTVRNLNLLQLCGEGGMTAVIRPVGIQNTNLCYRRIAVLLLRIIFLNMLKIPESHSQIQGVIKSL